MHDRDPRIAIRVAGRAARARTHSPHGHEPNKSEVRTTHIDSGRALMRRFLLWISFAVYCVAILLLLDFAYSNLFHVPRPPLRVPDANFDHGLAPNFDGYDLWADRIYAVRTNSLGFKDAAVREVPLSVPHRRTLLIGDSFAEGIGLPFEETFAGLLYLAGQSRPAKIEFLNASVASYSPTLYLRRIKALLDRGFISTKSSYSPTSPMLAMKQPTISASMTIRIIGHYAKRRPRPAPEFLRLAIPGCNEISSSLTSPFDWRGSRSVHGFRNGSTR